MRFKIINSATCFQNVGVNQNQKAFIVNILIFSHIF